MESWCRSWSKPKRRPAEPRAAARRYCLVSPSETGPNLNAPDPLPLPVFPTRPGPFGWPDTEPSSVRTVSKTRLCSCSTFDHASEAVRKARARAALTDFHDVQTCCARCTRRIRWLEIGQGSSRAEHRCHGGGSRSPAPFLQRFSTRKERGADDQKRKPTLARAILQHDGAEKGEIDQNEKCGDAGTATTAAGPTLAGQSRHEIKLKMVVIVHRCL